MGSVLSGGHVVFLGDSHGNTNYVVDSVFAAAENGVGTVIQLGDFGVWPGAKGDAFLKAVDSTAKKHEINFFFIDGNHEDFTQLEDAHANNYRHPSGAVHLTEHILWLPRGTVTNFGGRTFAFMGGSNSVDKSMRTPFISWWPQEQITQKDLYVLDENVAGQSVDVLVTHDAPGSVRFPFTPSAHWPDSALKEAAQQRKFLDEAVLITRPDLVIHGHWHTKYGSTGEIKGHTYRVQAYDMENSDGIGVLDLETLTVDPPYMLDAITESFNDRQLRRFDTPTEPEGTELETIALKNKEPQQKARISRTCGALTKNKVPCLTPLVDGTCPHHR